MTAEDKDRALCQQVLLSALADAPFDGFTPALLDGACARHGVGPVARARLFPDGVLSLVEAFSQWADAQMVTELEALELDAMKVRERIRTAVWMRLAVLRPHKEAARRAGAFLSLPMHAPRAAKLVWRSVDAMWRAAGDTASDFNFYSKRAILAGVYSATLVRWFNDDSAGEAATEQFLARRIEEVMRFETFKARLKKRLRAATDASRPLSPSRRRR